MNNIWYELEIMPLSATGAESVVPVFYRTMFDRSDANAGFDLNAAEAVIVTDTPEFIPFGAAFRLLKVEPFPGGTSNDYLKTDSHFWLTPRSSIYRSGLMMANSIGVIDKSYRGELKAPVWSMTGSSTVERGERLFQIVAPDMGWIRNVRIVDSMSETVRGAGGFGSTGR
jgi:dUTPase